MNPDNTAQNPEQVPQNPVPETKQPVEAPQGAAKVEPVTPGSVETVLPEQPKATITDIKPADPTPPTGVEDKKATVTEYTPPSTEPPKPNQPVSEAKPKKKFKIGAVLVPVFVILGLVFGSAFFVVYGKASFVPLEVKFAVSSVLLNIPFLPKTKEYVLLNAANANKDIKTGRVESDLAIKSSAMTDFVNTSDVNLSLNGVFDINDISNILANMNISYGEDISMDVISVTESSYIRINNLNPQVVTFLSVLDEEDLADVLDVWVQINKSASNLVQVAEDKVQPDGESDVTKVDFQAIFKEIVLPKIQMSTSESGSYVLSLDIDNDFLESLASEMEASGYKRPNFSGVGQGKLEVTFNSNNYMAEKILMSMSISSDIPSIGVPVMSDDYVIEGPPDLEEVSVLGDATSSQLEISVEINLSSLNEQFEFEISAPSESITSEEYLDRLMDLFTVILVKTYGDEEGNLDFDLETSSEVDSSVTDVEEITEDVEEDTPFGKILQ